jgi:hypothetical protein
MVDYKGARKAAREFIASKGGKVTKQELVDFLKSKFNYKYLQGSVDSVVKLFVRYGGLAVDGDCVTVGTAQAPKAPSPKAPAKK